MNVRLSDVQGESFHVNVIMKDQNQEVMMREAVSCNKKDNCYVGNVKADFSQVNAWDNHNPYLYTVYVEVLGENGELVEVVPYKVGFRRIEIIDKVMHLNGKRLVIVGVNRHEWNPKTGRCIGMEEMESEFYKHLDHS